MRRGYGFMLAAAVALSAAAPPASAQDQPIPEGYVLATPETMGVSPEVFARLDMPKGSYVKAGGPFVVSDGYSVYLPPEPIDRPSIGPVRIEPGAIAHRAIVRVDKQRWQAASPVVIGAPFNITMPGGTRFGGSLDASDGARPCFQPKPFAVSDEWLDEKGVRFLLLCLQKPDSQGRYRSARLLPMHADKVPRRDVDIAPVRLDPIAAGTSDPYFTAIFGVRQVRVVSLDGSQATLVLEVGAIRLGEEQGQQYPVEAVRDYRTVAHFNLPLKPGAQVMIAGVTLTVQRAGDGWSLVESGNFEEWARVSEDGSAVWIGELTFPPTIR